MAPPVNQTDIAQIEALIDGELSPAAAETLRQRIVNDPQLRAQYESLYQQKAILQLWWSKSSKN